MSWRLPSHFVHVVAFLYLPSDAALSVAIEPTETCASVDSTHQQAEVRTIEYSNYADEYDRDAQEGIDDADLINHMQVRLNVDIPVKSQAQRPDQQKHSSITANKRPAAEPTGHQPPAFIQESSVSSAAVVGHSSTSVYSTSSSSTESIIDAVLLRSGNQLVLGSILGASLVISGLFLAFFIRALLAARKIAEADGSKLEAKASLQEQMLEPIKAELKVLPTRKKFPPMASASDSGDTDEEEPEAESDSGDLLEDAVFVAEQVERANEAFDAGYGYPNKIKVDDRICA